MPRLYWHKMEGRKDIIFGETPISMAVSKFLGAKYFKQQPLKGKCFWLQGTRKIECQALVEVKSFTLYPVSKDEKEGLSMQRLWCV